MKKIKDEDLKPRIDCKNDFPCKTCASFGNCVTVYSSERLNDVLEKICKFMESRHERKSSQGSKEDSAQ